MRLLVGAFLALLPFACSSFDSSDPAKSSGGGVDGGNGAGDSSPNTDIDGGVGADAGGRAKMLYIFGGVTIVDQNEETAAEAYAAPILDDGLLGPWELAPALDLARSYMTTIDAPNGLLIMAGGNGLSLGEGQSGNHIFFRNDVGIAGGEPLTSWKPAPALGTNNGRWAGAGTFALGHAYIGGGIVEGGGYTNTILTALVTPTLQSWKAAGTLPLALADHGLVGLGSHLYAIGGMRDDSGTTAETFKAPIAGDQTVGNWAATAALPTKLKAFGVVGAGTQVFVIGGEDGATKVSASVYIGSQTPTQDLVWQESTPLNHGRRHLCVLRANGRLYALGGGTISSMTQVVEVGDVSGTSITWRQTTLLPGIRSAFGCAAR